MQSLGLLVSTPSRGVFGLSLFPTPLLNFGCSRGGWHTRHHYPQSGLLRVKRYRTSDGILDYLAYWREDFIGGTIPSWSHWFHYSPLPIEIPVSITQLTQFKGEPPPPTPTVEDSLAHGRRPVFRYASRLPTAIGKRS